jgi:putative endonuclease
MYYVYILEAIDFPNKLYVGYTTDLKQRFATHNSGGSVHTAKYRPWKLVMYLGFADKEKAVDFELYLKSQAGRAFMQKRLV